MMSQDEAMILIPGMLAGGIILFVLVMGYLKHRAKSDASSAASDQ